MYSFFSLFKIFTRERFWVYDVEFIKETPKAYLIWFCGQKEWNPKSKIYKVDTENKRIYVDDFWYRKFA